MNTDIDSTHVLGILLATAIGSVAGYLGSLMVTKRMSLMGGALGHLTLPGVALALRYGFDVSIGAFACLMIGISVIWWLEQLTRLPIESLTAYVFATFLAFAFLVLPEQHAHEALLGALPEIPLYAWIGVMLLLGVIFLVTRSLYASLMLASVSPELAQVSGYNLKQHTYIYLLCIACIIALGVRIVGGLMTAALVAIPAITARLLSRTLHGYEKYSFVTGAISCLVGAVVSLVTGYALGACVIIASATLFIIAVVWYTFC